MTKIVLTTPADLLASALAAVANDACGFADDATLDDTSLLLHALFDNEVRDADFELAYNRLRDIFQRTIGASEIIEQLGTSTIEFDTELGVMVVDGKPINLKLMQDAGDALEKSRKEIERLNGVLEVKELTIKKLANENVELRRQANEAKISNDILTRDLTKVRYDLDTLKKLRAEPVVAVKEDTTVATTEPKISVAEVHVVGSVDELLAHIARQLSPNPSGSRRAA